MAWSLIFKMYCSMTFKIHDLCQKHFCVPEALLIMVLFTLIYIWRPIFVLTGFSILLCLCRLQHSEESQKVHQTAQTSLMLYFPAAL